MRSQWLPQRTVIWGALLHEHSGVASGGGGMGELSEARRGEARRGSGHWVTHASHPPRNVSTLCLALGVPHLPCRAAPLALRPLLVNLSKHEECEPFRRLTLGAHNSVVPVGTALG